MKATFSRGESVGRRDDFIFYGVLPWQWQSTAMEADRFADAMMAINPNLPIVLKVRRDYGG